MKGMLEHGDLKETLWPAPWFKENASVSNANIKCGMIEGHIRAEYQPRYRQLDDVSDEIDASKRYLFVKVLRVDRVVTPDSRPVEDIDTFVEVRVGRESKKTSVQNDTASPKFNSELWFELASPKDKGANTEGGTGATEDEHFLDSISGLGPVHFDLWTDGLVSNGHLGWCKVYLDEILTDEKGQTRETVGKAFVTRRKHGEDTYRTRVFRGCKELCFIWDADRGSSSEQSNLFFEMWFMRDLGPLAKLKRIDVDTRLPRSLSRYALLRTEWMDRVSKLAVDGRCFPCEIATQRRQPSFFPRLLDEITPPRGIRQDRNAVADYIGCIPYAPKLSKEVQAYTPDFFVLLRQGEAIDHALLHVSFLLGLKEKAFVCLGTLAQGSRHVWVTTLEADGTVRFWEPHVGAGSWALSGRLAQAEWLHKRRPWKFHPAQVQEEAERRNRLLAQMRRPSRPSRARVSLVGGCEAFDFGGCDPVLPYRTVDVVFDNYNCWANLQHPHPGKIFWDLWNPMYWYPFAPSTSGLTPCFPSCRFPVSSRDDDWCRALTCKLEQRLKAAIRLVRNQRNLGTTFVRSKILTKFLEAGLKLRARLESSSDDDRGGALARLEDWQHLFEGKTPSKHTHTHTHTHRHAYIHTHSYTHTQTQTQTYTHKHTHTHTHTCTHIYTHVHTHTITYTHTHTHTCTHTYTHTHTHVHTHTITHTHTYTYIHTHTHSHTHTYTHTHASAPAETHTRAHAHTHTRTSGRCYACGFDSCVEKGTSALAVFFMCRLVASH